MTVNEYRQKHPNCKYCIHNCYYGFSDRCVATNKIVLRWTAKWCPCYKARNFIESQLSEVEKSDGSITGKIV